MVKGIVTTVLLRYTVHGTKVFEFARQPNVFVIFLVTLLSVPIVRSSVLVNVWLISPDETSGTPVVYLVPISNDTELLCEKDSVKVTLFLIESVVGSEGISESQLLMER